MKRIYNNLKYFVAAVVIATASSCEPLIDEDVTDFGTGPDFVGFTRAVVTAPIEVTGEAKTYNAVIDLFGPGSETFDEEVVVTFRVDDANSTAEAGVHYDLPSGNTVTLNEANDFRATVPITVYTEGIEPPISEELVLEITDVSTASSEPVIISDTGDTQVVTISYICFADLTGTYTMTNSVCGAEVTDVTITPNEDGGWYLSTADGGLLQYCSSNTGLQNDGVIIEVCGDILPSDDLSFCPGYGIGCITGGSWDAETGTLTLEHTNAFFGFANANYSSTYVRTSTEVAE